MFNISTPKHKISLGYIISPFPPFFHKNGNPFLPIPLYNFMFILRSEMLSFASLINNSFNHTFPHTCLYIPYSPYLCLFLANPFNNAFPTHFFKLILWYHIRNPNQNRNHKNTWHDCKMHPEEKCCTECIC